VTDDFGVGWIFLERRDEYLTPAHRIVKNEGEILDVTANLSPPQHALPFSLGRVSALLP
jgi:hypothetical protein